jgi:hypothetical protein
VGVRRNQAFLRSAGYSQPTANTQAIASTNLVNYVEVVSDGCGGDEAKVFLEDIDERAHEREAKEGVHLRSGTRHQNVSDVGRGWMVYTVSADGT